MINYIMNLAQQHIDSFDQLIEEVIPNIVRGQENVIFKKIDGIKSIKSVLEFEDLIIKPPMLDSDEELRLMLPIDAIQNRLSYVSIYSATVTQ